MTRIVQLIVPTSGSWAGFLLALTSTGTVYYQNHIDSGSYEWVEMNSKFRDEIGSDSNKSE